MLPSVLPLLFSSRLDVSDGRPVGAWRTRTGARIVPLTWPRCSRVHQSSFGQKAALAMGRLRSIVEYFYSRVCQSPGYFVKHMNIKEKLNLA